MLLQLGELSGLTINYGSVITYCCIIAYVIETKYEKKYFQLEVRFVFDKENFINNMFLQIKNAWKLYSEVLYNE